MIALLQALTFYELRAAPDEQNATARVESDALWSDGPTSYIKMHRGSWQGYTTFGIGISFFNQIVETEMLYSFTPEIIAGRNVHSLVYNFRVMPFDLDVHRFDWVPLYAGIGGILNLDRGTHISRQSQYPGDYYTPTGVRAVITLGSQFSWQPEYGLFKQYSLYIEWGLLDVDIEAYLRQNYLKLTDLMVPGLGIKAHW